LAVGRWIETGFFRQRRVPLENTLQGRGEFNDPESFDFVRLSPHFAQEDILVVQEALLVKP
jgi:hypothetical protein